MSGATILARLLAEDEQLQALPTKPVVKAGAFPEKVTLPAILMREISTVDEMPLKPGPFNRRTDRVGVLIRAASYREMVAIFDIVRRRYRHFLGPVDGVHRLAILLAGAGPGLTGPGNSFERTQDLRVSFDEPTT